MRVTMQNANIRGCEIKTNKKGDDYIIVRAEDETGKACELVDKDMSRKDYYTRNKDMDITIDISVGKYTTIRIVDAKVITVA